MDDTASIETLRARVAELEAREARIWAALGVVPDDPLGIVESVALVVEERDAAESRAQDAEAELADEREASRDSYERMADALRTARRSALEELKSTVVRALPENTPPVPPRVTSEDFYKLGFVAGQVAQSGEETERLRRELALDSPPASEHLCRYSPCGGVHWSACRECGAPADCLSCPDCDPPRRILDTPSADTMRPASWCRSCPHPPHLGTCTKRNGGTAYACGCSAQPPIRDEHDGTHDGDCPACHHVGAPADTEGES